jgi:hypothetical protein
VHIIVLWHLNERCYTSGKNQVFDQIITEAVTKEAAAAKNQPNRSVVDLDVKVRMAASKTHAGGSMNINRNTLERVAKIHEPTK